MKTNKILAVAVVAAALLSPISAISGPVNTGTQAQTFSFNLLDANTTFSFNGFNSTLGALNSVHFEWTMNKTLNNNIINITTSPQTIGNPTPVTATSTTTFTGSGVALLLTDVNTLTTIGFTGLVPGNFAITTVGTASAPNLSGGVCLSNDNSCGAGNTDLSGYIGGLNLFNIAISNTGTQGGSVPSNVFSGNTGTAAGTVSIFYDYNTGAFTNHGLTPVPEPAGLGLMSFGLFGLAAFRKKKQAKS